MPFRSRKQKKKAHTIPTSAPPHTTSPPAPTEESKKGPVIPSVLIASVEKAADFAKRELTNTGNINPKALFVYDEQSDPRVTVVSLAWRNEFDKDALRKKIRDKALQEAARAVVVTGMQPMEAERLLILSGMTPETVATASVDYVFDGDTRTIGLWEFRWLNVTSGNIVWGDLPD